MEEFDVIIAGGGTAGLSAALVLVRALKKTLVCGSGEPRNAPSHQSHSFFSRDGASPAELLRIGRQQLAPYESVEVREALVVKAWKNDGVFEVELENGSQLRARKILLATGMVDELPPIEGLQAMWGVSALHCPYCHGWEVRDQSLAVYGSGAVGFEFCKLIRGWSRDLVLCSDGPANLTEEQWAQLNRQHISVREERILRFEGTGGQLEGIVFDNGEVLTRQAIFIRPGQRQRSGLPEMLGCHIEDGFVQVDEMGQTSVAGVYAAGDMTHRFQQLSYAAFSGARAASVINHALLAEDFVK